MSLFVLYFHFQAYLTMILNAIEAVLDIVSQISNSSHTVYNFKDNS